MGISNSERLLRKALGMCLALLACLLVAPPNVLAGCSPDLRHPDKSGLGLELLVSVRQSIGLVPEVPAQPVPPSTPRGNCSGPSCSQLPVLPRIPSLNELRIVDSWACPAPSIAVGEPDSRWNWPELRNDAPFHQGPSVFHPPRSTFSS